MIFVHEWSNLATVLERHLSERLLAGLADSPVVFVQGARQTGKSTLVRALADGVHPARYLTLDDPGLLASARSDARGFVDGLQGDVVIDEVQSCPELFAAIKLVVDRDRRPGRFLLTGSANALVVPELSRALTGRVDLISLRSLSQGEIEGRRERFVDFLFSDAKAPIRLGAPAGVASRVATGGYPEVVARRGAERRAAWFDAYVATILQRDVRDLADIERLVQLPDLLRMSAARVATVVNFAELARALALPQTTLKRYFALFEAVFLLQRVPAWSANLGKRLVRSPKLFVLDSGLACHLQGVDSAAWNEPATRRGALLENFVFGELDKQLGWSTTRASLHHYRSHSGDEVDFVLEDRKGRVVGVEVKASATLAASDAAPLKKLAGELRARFVRGVVLYTGDETIPFDRHIHALPLSALWKITE